MTEIVFPGVSNRVGNSRNRRGRGGGGVGGIVVGVSNKHPLEWKFPNGDGAKAHNCPPWKGGMDIFWD